MTCTEHHGFRPKSLTTETIKPAGSPPAFLHSLPLKTDFYAAANFAARAPDARSTLSVSGVL